MSLIPISEFEDRSSHTIRLLKSLVEHETPTTEKAQLDKLGHYIADRAREMQAKINVYPQEKAGDHWSFSWGPPEKEFLILTHMDTVYDVGTLEIMPWREEENLLYGPGVLDMKFGIATALTVIGKLLEQAPGQMRGITLLCTSDEETGSSTSREIIEILAQDHKLSLCLEPALPDGSLKTWRKGIGGFKIRTEGISAHAGSEPNPGINAIQEMAYQLIELASIADPEKGTSLNLGVIRGGTRTNVVAEACTCRFDVRVKTVEEQAYVEESLASLSPALEGATVSVGGSWNRPPMQRTPLIAETFERARAIAAKIGLTLSEGGTGGGSDANFVAVLGLPVLDGLGAVGEGAHSRDENVQINCIPERAALLAALLMDW